MATKPRAVKAMAPAAKTTPAASSTPKTAARSVPAKPVKPAAKVVARAVKPAGRPLAKPAVKPAAKLAVKPKAMVKPAAKAVARPAPKRGAANVPAALKRAVKAVAVVAPAISGNPTLVRDSFTMPEAEYAVFASAKQRCLQAGVEIKKSELLRIGMTLVGQLDVAMLQAVLAGLPQLKTGRPRSES